MKMRTYLSVWVLLSLAVVSGCSGKGDGYQDCRGQSEAYVNQEHRDPSICESHFFACVWFQSEHTNTEYDWLAPPSRRESLFKNVDQAYAVFVLPEAAQAATADPAVESPAAENAMALIRQFVPLEPGETMYTADLDSYPSVRFERGAIGDIGTFAGSAIYYVGIDHEAKCLIVVQEEFPWFFDDEQRSGVWPPEPYYP